MINTTCYVTDQTGPALKPDNMQQPIDTTLPNAFPNGGSSLHQRQQTAVDISAHARRIDVPPSVLLAQVSNVGMIQGMNGGMIKSEVGYVRNS
ncbi:unnamed protein product [Ilex paraguariensis]|uniref:Uncharacterized protein n=1 Tax=Ilex paraguariensis TaxID=185542 RepID=A0ABC8RQM6_9AQUA